MVLLQAGKSLQVGYEIANLLEPPKPGKFTSHSKKRLKSDF